MLLHPFSPTPAVNDFVPMPSVDSLSRRAHWSAGQPISYLMHMALARPSLISLAAGFVDQHSLPVEPTRKALEAILSEPVAASSAAVRHDTRLPPASRTNTRAGWWPPTAPRAAIFRWTRSCSRPVATSCCMSCATRSWIRAISCCVRPPNYFVFLGMLANFGDQSVGIASDEQGIVPESLDEAPRTLAAHRRIVAHEGCLRHQLFRQSPQRDAGRRPPRRPWSRSSAAGQPTDTIYILEDTAYRELRYAGDRPAVAACL